MSTWRLAMALVLFLTLWVPHVLWAQTLTLEPAPPPAEPRQVPTRVLSASDEGPVSSPLPASAGQGSEATVGTAPGDVRQSTTVSRPPDSLGPSLAPAAPITSVDLRATEDGRTASGESQQPVGAVGPAQVPDGEGEGKATLAAQVRPSPAPRPSGGSIELEATKFSVSPPWGVAPDTPWTLLLAFVLFLSLAGNAFQFYRHRVFGKTLSNELLSAFNSIAWSFERCIRKRRDLDARSAQRVSDPVMLREFREFTLDSEFMLRTLREQLRTVARNLHQREQRWESDTPESLPEETKATEETLPHGPESRTA